VVRLPLLPSALAALFLSACAGSGLSSTPTWPKSAGTVIPADWSEDGGESLEPRQPEEVAALDEEDEEEVEQEVEAADKPAAEKTDKPAAAAAPTGEVSIELQYEEILFEDDASADGEGDGD